ncbi:MAG: VWA domain-containing protein [Candidatus Acidiferrales bacterium]
MAKRSYACSLILLTLISVSAVLMAAQDTSQNQVIRVEVNLVQLNVAVTDSKGNYVTGLRPQDFAITEDKIPQKIAIFEEGNGAPQTIADAGPVPAQPGATEASQASVPAAPPDDSAERLGVAVAGADVFVLFDTSDYMYLHQGFVLAQDAIADFLRSLENADRVAFYSYSRNVSREALLTADRSEVLRGVRDTVAGDDAALYDALLLTLKDAGGFTGRKVVVVFSNGPDNASAISPDVVGELAQSEGIPIYMICTREAQEDPLSAEVFTRMSMSTGGRAFFASSWRGQKKAFSLVRDDLAHLYSLSYYPQENPNRGWRAIKVTLVGPRLKKYHIRTRSGYRPIPRLLTQGTTPSQ